MELLSSLRTAVEPTIGAMIPTLILISLLNAPSPVTIAHIITISHNTLVAHVPSPPLLAMASDALQQIQKYILNRVYIPTGAKYTNIKLCSSVKAECFRKEYFEVIACDATNSNAVTTTSSPAAYTVNIDDKATNQISIVHYNKVLLIFVLYLKSSKPPAVSKERGTTPMPSKSLQFLQSVVVCVCVWSCVADDAIW